MSNHLSVSKKILCLSLLCEGNSIRSIERITNVNRNTIMSLLISSGHRANEIMDSKFQNLKCNHLQIDEIWSFVKKKQNKVSPKDKNKNEFGDQYTFIALDSDTKLVPYFLIGKRTYQTALSFIEELKNRITNRIQISTDAFPAYKNVIDEVYGIDVDYMQIHKTYGEEPKREKRYSPSKIIKFNKVHVMGKPNPDKASTSYVERQNLTLRMNNRRFTRLTNAFSKKLENLQCAVALHFFYYNFMRVHQTLQVTPCMEAGIEKSIWSWEQFLGVKTQSRKVA